MKINILSTAIAALLSAVPASQADEKPAPLEAGKPLTFELKTTGSGDSGVVVSSGTGVLKLSGNAVPQSGTVIVTGGGATGQSKTESGVLTYTGSATVPAKALQVGNVVVSGGAEGTATITIDVDGKTETRTFKIGDKPLEFNAIAGAGANAPLQKETWIGLALGGSVSDEVRAQLNLKTEEGVSVGAVIPESPAAKAGLQQHDVLVRMDDQILISADQFKALVKMHKSGETAKLVYFRKGEREEALVTFTEREAQPVQHDVFRLLEHPEKLKGGKWTERLDGAKDKLEGLREKLKTAKDRYPGVVVESKAFVVGPDGKVANIEGKSKGDLNAVKEALKHLDEAGILKKEELAKSVEELRKTLEAARSSAKVFGGELKDDVTKRIQEELDKAGLNKEGVQSRIEAARKALEIANGSLKSMSGELRESLTKELREKLEKSGLNKEQLDAVSKTLEGITETAEQTILRAVQEALKAADKEEKADGAKQ